MYSQEPLLPLIGARRRPSHFTDRTGTAPLHTESMVRLTLISRVHDGLSLAEGLDNEKDKDLDHYKLQAKVSLLFPLVMLSDAVEHCFEHGPSHYILSVSYRCR